jgi:hypothetical protein
VVVVGKSGTAVDDHDAVLLLDGQAVHAYFAEAPERYQANGVGG